MRSTVVFLLALAACASSRAIVPQGGFPSLEAAMTAQTTHNVQPGYSAGEWGNIAGCLGPSLVRGIPAGDQAAMLRAVNAGKMPPDVDALFSEWMGVSPARGQPVKPDPTDPATFAGGKLHYADGSPVADVTPENSTRVQQNAQTICPDLVSKYPEIFKGWGERS